MSNYISSLLVEYRNQGIVIDTNILLLWVVGTVNPKRIEKFSPTDCFNLQDYELLLPIIDYFQKIVTTANILTEVNSFLNKLREPERSQSLLILAKATENLEEIYLPSSQVVTHPKFTTFGLTDSGIVEISRNQYLVLTDDLKLWSYLNNSGIAAINFNHIRELGWAV
ncbi:PIN domain-containing protein [Spirulina sp. CS-785/01]|uniref:PIN domain-containing protein n=1 Tax=Spirulina sp. CS-785/01 TaxID=3021716 RepID=UPI00232E032B|nr:PIN domain-containing protein [Spirulina sp. CS-785/01]MDB9313789.1 PIN domain-containing protein [Spirulina sp. CS-785/01]